MMGPVPQTRRLRLRRSQLIWLAAVIVVGVVVGVLFGAWWGVGAALLVLALNEVLERIQRART